MLDPKILDDISQRLHTALPEGLRTVQRDIDRNMRAAVQAALARLDLVTREEFDIQTKVLARTRAQLDALAQRVADLEEKVLGKPRTPDNNGSADEQDRDGG